METDFRIKIAKPKDSLQPANEAITIWKQRFMESSLLDCKALMELRTSVMKDFQKALQMDFKDETFITTFNCKPESKDKAVNTEPQILPDIKHRNLKKNFEKRLILILKSNEYHLFIEDMKICLESEQNGALDQVVFARMASCYVKILSLLQNRDRDEFIKHFPDIVAENVYSNQDISFVCDLVNYWMTGIKSRNQQWKNKTLKQEKSSVLGPGPKTQRVKFSLKGQSPLLACFLKTRENSRSIYIHVQERQLNESKMTYADLIHESQLRSKREMNTYLKSMSQSQRERKKIQLQLQSSFKEEEKKFLKISQNEAMIKLECERLLGTKVKSEKSHTSMRIYQRLHVNFDLAPLK